MRKSIILLLFLICFIVAQVPRTMNYQGKITDPSGVALNGTYSITFRIWNSITSGTMLWSENHPAVSVNKGLFDVVLGSTTPINLPFNMQYFMELVVAGETLTPRTPLTSAGYSIRAIYADSVGGSAGGGVSRVDQGTGITLTPNPIVATGSVAFNQIWGDAVYVNEGQVNSITSAMIVDGQVTSSDLQDGACLTEILDDDGHGSALDADLLDGYHASSFSLATHNHDHNTLTNLQTAGSGVTFGHITDGAQTIAGAKTFSSAPTAPYYISTATTGVPPLMVSSTTLVTNLNADLLDGYHASFFSPTTHTHCAQRWTCGDSGLTIVATRNFGFSGTSNDTAKAGVRGIGGTRSSGVLGTSSWAPGGGVEGAGSGTDGVYGYATGVNTAGGYFTKTDTTGWGVYGLSGPRGGAILGATAGYAGSWYMGTAVTGLSKNLAGFFDGDTTAQSWGLWAQTRDENGIAAYARSVINTTSGRNYAVFAACSTGMRKNAADSIVALGVGVYAINFGDSGSAIIGVGNNLNVINIINSGSGVNGNGKEVGVFGYSNSTDESSVGLLGRTPDTAGVGVVGSDNDLVPSFLSRGAGVLGYSDNVGVFGRGSTAANSYGVYGLSDNSTNGFAIVGFGPTGVYGSGNSTTAVNTGVFGYVGNYTGGVDVGVFGQSFNTTADYAGYFSGRLHSTGNFTCGGTKSAIVETDEGWRTLYCQESPEIWFEDFGEGRLTGGRAIVRLNDDFVKFTTINEKYPMKVFVQLTDPNCKGVAVKKHKDYFEVIELAQGESNATFDWRVVAKRKGYEDYRSEVVDPATVNLTREMPIEKTINQNTAEKFKSIEMKVPTPEDKFKEREISLERKGD